MTEAMQQPRRVSREAFNALSPLHREIAERLLIKTGRWVITDDQSLGREVAA